MVLPVPNGLSAIFLLENVPSRSFMVLNSVPLALSFIPVTKNL